MIQDNPDKSWERFGASDPYYAVLTDPRFRGDKLDADAIQLFYRSGEEHIQSLLQRLEQRFGDFGKGLALDFGCGVGRLVAPLAHRYEKVFGIDISEAMLQIAKTNMENMGIQGTEFYSSIGQAISLKQHFQLVHSYIVFQHIPVPRGEQIFTQLVDLVAPGGIGALHLTLSRKRSALHYAGRWLRYNFAPANVCSNLISGREPFEPLMQMNDYNLNRLMQILHHKGICNISLDLLADGDNHLSSYIIFQKSKSSG